MHRAFGIAMCVTLMLLAIVVFAQPPGPIDPLRSSWWIVCPPGLMQVSNCPAGDLEQVAASCGPPGPASIEYRLVDVNGNPVIGLPPTDIWFQPASAAEVLFFKPGAPVADAPTNLAGRAWTTIALSAGGCATLGVQCVVLDPVAGISVVLQNPPVIGIVFKSPDLTADGVVNLSDLATFGRCYNQQPANPCCDFTDDGPVNLSDFAVFGMHYMHM